MARATSWNTVTSIQRRSPRFLSSSSSPYPSPLPPTSNAAWTHRRKRQTSQRNNQPLKADSDWPYGFEVAFSCSLCHDCLILPGYGALFVRCQRHSDILPVSARFRYVNGNICIRHEDPSDNDHSTSVNIHPVFFRDDGSLLRISRPAPQQNVFCSDLNPNSFFLVCASRTLQAMALGASRTVRSLSSRIS
ncbi:hypothetical protein Agabi119p4_2538 [Agaricus bisporus var. burnettii]|uniref:Uncharacterized protein n=1 Tax=Agaricus bisporus var. burnettii TaxID=192524 RepID=A0A8H7F9G9_AGABI|nr:hypothetical protein Agabi119p4_2538 [Agaricus bisporus var. burnettii]